MPTYTVKTKAGTKTISYNAFSGSRGTVARGSEGTSVGTGLNNPAVSLAPGLSREEEEAQAQSIAEAQARLDRQIAEGKAPSTAKVTDFISPPGGMFTGRYAEEDVKEYSANVRQYNEQAGNVRGSKPGEMTAQEAVQLVRARGLRGGAESILASSRQAQNVEYDQSPSVFSGRGLLGNLGQSSSVLAGAEGRSNSMLPRSGGEVHAAEKRGLLESAVSGLRTKSELSTGTKAVLLAGGAFGLSVVKGALDVVLHPIQTGAGIINTFIHPVRSLQMVGQGLASSPIETSGELTGQLLTMKVLSIGAGKSAGFVVGKVREARNFEPIFNIGKTETASIITPARTKVVAASVGRVAYKDNFGFLKEIDYKSSFAANKVKQRISANAEVNILKAKGEMLESIKIKDVYSSPKAESFRPMPAAFKAKLQEAIRSNPAPVIGSAVKFKQGMSFGENKNPMAKISSAFEQGFDNPLSRGRSYPDRIPGLNGQRRRMPGRLPERNTDLELIEVSQQRGVSLQQAEKSLSNSLQSITNKEVQGFIQKSNRNQLMRFEGGVRSRAGLLFNLNRKQAFRTYDISRAGLLQREKTVSRTLPDIMQKQTSISILGLKGLQNVRLEQRNAVASRQLIRQQLGLRQQQRQEQRSKTASVLTLAAVLKPLNTLGFKFKLDQKRRKKGNRFWPNTNFEGEYFPSLEAEIFGITSKTKPSRASIGSGLTTRPIIR